MTFTSRFATIFAIACELLSLLASSIGAPVWYGPVLIFGAIWIVATALVAFAEFEGFI